MYVFLYLEIIPKGYLQRKMMSNHQVIASFQGRTHPFHMSVIKKKHIALEGEDSGAKLGLAEFILIHQAQT
jgi:hypothetical protein